MKFGHVEIHLTDFEYKLPADAVSNASVLYSSKGSNNLQVHVGTPKWSNKHWLGKIYPPKTKDAEFLKEYAKHFNTVEFGATFYGHQPPERIELFRKMVEQTPDFKFCPKFPQSVTHIRRFRNCEEHTEKFYDSVAAFGDHLGPLFLQLADNFTPKGFPELKAYLETLPKDQIVFVEVRNKDWFAIPTHHTNLFDLLHASGIGTVISDTVGRRDCLHMELTIPHAFIRFVGIGDDPINYKRLDEWVERIREWREDGLQSLWFFVHGGEANKELAWSTYLINNLNHALGLTLEAPKILKA